MSPYGRFYISLDSSLCQIKDCDGSPLTTLKIEFHLAFTYPTPKAKF